MHATKIIQTLRAIVFVPCSRYSTSVPKTLKTCFNNMYNDWLIKLRRSEIKGYEPVRVNMEKERVFFKQMVLVI